MTIFRNDFPSTYGRQCIHILHKPNGVLMEFVLQLLRGFIGKSGDWKHCIDVEGLIELFDIRRAVRRNAIRQLLKTIKRLRARGKTTSMSKERPKQS